MSELHGLSTILAGSGTLHGIQGPPVREDFSSLAEYEIAYRVWYARVHLWRAEIKR